MRRNRQRNSLYSETADPVGEERRRTADGESGRRRRQWGLGIIGGTAVVTSIAVLPGIAAAGAAAAAAPPLGVTTAARAEPAAVRVAGGPVPVLAAAPVAAPAERAGDGTGVEAFWAAGYTHEDALVLASFWGIDSELEVKVRAGELLAAGTALADSPYADPGAARGYPREELAALFWACGYDAADAGVLAGAWGVSVEEAAVRAGAELKTVGVLPLVDPVLPPATAGWDGIPPEFEAFFAAGFDFDDSVLLAGHWGLPGFEEAKFEAGRLLLAGEPLPQVTGVAPA